MAVAGLVYQWPPRADGQNDVAQTAAHVWRAHEEASWEALRLHLETSFAATETEHTRQWREPRGPSRAER